MEILTIETRSLGDRSYVVVDGDAAAVIDPQRDVDRVLDLVAAHGVTVRLVLETHLHNDYVSGGLDLARRTGAAYVVPEGAGAEFDHVAGSDGAVLAVGGRTVLRAVRTPGHTPHHLSYVALVDGQPTAVFTGGSMLFGTVGRTDLIGDEATESLTRAQFHSVRRLAETLPGGVSVHPTHGFGSFCSSSATTSAEASTIDEERRTNIACTVAGEDDFVERLLGGLTAHPRYYAHMAPINRHGPAPADLSPPEPADPAVIRGRIAAGEWVVDLRERTAFARSHLAGTVNVEVGDSFVTYLGWTIRWGTPVTLVADTPEQVAEAQRQLVRIGIDRPAGAAHGGLAAWASGGELRSYRSASFAELARERAEGGLVVLDVRRSDEWDAGHIEGAAHIPLDELEERIDEVPADVEVWVHCATGFRASIAASLLDRAGRRVVAVHDEWEQAAHRHLPLAS